MKRSVHELAVQLTTAFLMLIIAVVGAMWMSGDIGVLQRGSVAGDARRKGQLPTEWRLVSGEEQGVMALLFYDADDPGQCNAQVYVRRTGVSGTHFKLGWFYLCGDSGVNHGGDALHNDADAPVVAWQLPAEGKHDQLVYMSANAAGITEARTEDGSTRLSLDAGPFAIVTSAALRFFDADGTEVPCAARAMTVADTYKK